MKPWFVKYYDENGEVSDSWYAKSLADTSICCEIEPGKYAFLLSEIEDPMWIRAWYDGEMSDYAEDYPDAEENEGAYEAYAYDSFSEFFDNDQYYYWNGEEISRIASDLTNTTNKWDDDPCDWSSISGQLWPKDRLIANILKAKPGSDLKYIISEQLDSEEEPNDVLNEILDIIEDTNDSLREDFANFLYWNGDDLGINTWDWGIMGEFYPEEFPDENPNYWNDDEDEGDYEYDWGEEDEDDEGPWDEDVDDILKDIGVF